MLYRFGRYELDEEAGELRCDGEPLALQPKPFELLRALLRKRDRVVSQDELLAELWPDAIVAPGSLTKAVSLARRAVGDSGRGERIRSLAKRGYRFIGDVEVTAARSAERPVEQEPEASQAPDTSTSSSASAHDRPPRPLLGREDVFARLAQAFERTTSRRGGVALVTGTPGIGKTHLVESFSDDLRERGALVAIGRARDGEGVPAFWLWAQVLRRLLDDDGARSDVLALAGRAGELAALVPELDAPRAADAVSRASDPADGDAVNARFLLFDAVARALRRASERRPLAIVLEDLQWAGLPSLRLLEHLAFEIGDAAILVIATVRDEQRDPDAPVERTLALLRTQHGSESIALRPLSRGEVAKLLEQRLGSPVPVDVVSELFARTEGVPLFVIEAARALDAPRDERDVDALARRALAVGAPAAPRVEWIDRALAALDAETREQLAVAATIGREFAIPLLASACEREPRELLVALERAERAGVVTAPASPAEPWRFAHALFREAALRSLGRAERASLHVRIADRLEALLGDEAIRAASELAHHHHEGLVVGDPERAYQWATRAASRARDVLAFEQEAGHLVQALAALDHVGASTGERRLACLLALVEADRRSGERTRRRRAAREAMDVARSLGHPRELARAAIGLVDIGEWGSRDDEGERALAEAARALGDDGSLEQVRLTTRIANLAIGLSRAQAEPVAREAVARARRLGNARALMEALYTLHYAIAGPDDLAERRALTSEAVELCGTHAVPDALIIALVDVASDAITRGDLADARALRALALQVGREAWTPAMAWHVEVFDTGIAMLEGRLDDADRLRERALALGRRISHPYASGCWLVHRVEGLSARGEHRDALALLESVWSDGGRDRLGGIRSDGARDLHWVRALAGQLLFTLGRTSEARLELDRLSASGFVDIPRNIRWLKGVVEIAGLCADVGDRALASELIAMLDPYAELHAVLPVPIAYGGPVSGALARLHATLGDLEASLRAFESAIAACARLGARPARARLLAQRADLAREAGDSDRARADATEALAEAEVLGLAGLAASLRERRLAPA